MATDRKDDVDKVIERSGHDTLSPVVDAGVDVVIEEVVDALISELPVGKSLVALKQAREQREFRRDNAAAHREHSDRLDDHQEQLTRLQEVPHEDAGGVELSGAASRLALYLAQHSEHGSEHDPTVETERLPAALDMSGDDLTLAIHELRDLDLIGTIGGHSSIGGFHEVYPRAELFIDVDEHLPERVPGPSADAAVLVGHLAETPLHNGHVRVDKLAGQLAWPARRMNPAMATLIRDGLVEAEPYCYGPRFDPGGIEVLPALHHKARRG